MVKPMWIDEETANGGIVVRHEGPQVPQLSEDGGYGEVEVIRPLRTLRIKFNLDYRLPIDIEGD